MDPEPCLQRGCPPEMFVPEQYLVEVTVDS
jgi:hypothetical protein